MTTKNELKLLEEKLFAYEVAEADLKWTTYGIDEIIAKLDKIKKDLNRDYGVPEIEFEDLTIFLDMHEHLMSMRHDITKDERDSAQRELDIAKGKTNE